MVKAKVLSSAGLALALLVSSAVVAHAGGGGQGSPITTPMFQCYFIQGGSNLVLTTPPYVLELTDQFGTRQNVGVGLARLLCTPISAATVEHGPALKFVDPNLVDHLKCYDILTPRVGGPGAVAQVTDPFAVDTVTVGPASLLCAGAIKELVGR